MPSPLEIADLIADALLDVSPEYPIDVSPKMEFAPGGPMIDIYPDDPAEEDLAFGRETAQDAWIVRVRVPTADEGGAQDFLLNARKRTGAGSVRAALLTIRDDDVGIDGIIVGRPTGYRLYDPVAGAGTYGMLGQEWRVVTLVSDEQAS